MKSIIKKQGFTLVELIVTIVILAILGAIAFISFQGYSRNTRDSARIADINSIQKSLAIFMTKTGYYPTPDESKTITYNGGDAWVEGTIGDNVIKNIEKVSKKPIDPLTSDEFTYSITAGKTEYQLGAISEMAISLNNGLNQSYATDISKAKAFIRGTYNEKFLKVATGGIQMLLVQPSIIVTDIGDTDLGRIIQNKKVVYNDYDNIPHSYNHNSSMTGGFDYTPGRGGDIVVLTGATLSLTGDTAKIDFINNVQSVLSGTILAGGDEYEPILAIDPTDNTGIILLVDSFIRSKAGGITGDVSNIYPGIGIIDTNTGTTGTNTGEVTYTYFCEGLYGDAYNTQFDRDYTDFDLCSNTILIDSISNFPVSSNLTNNPGARDVYAFVLESGKSYDIETLGDDGDSDTAIYLFDKDGNSLIMNDDLSGNIYRSKVTYTPLYSGYYYLGVMGYNDGGIYVDYQVDIQELVPPISCNLSQSEVDELNSLVGSLYISAYDGTFDITNQTVGFNNYIKYLGVNKVNASSLLTGDDWCYSIKNIVWNGGTTFPSGLGKLYNLEGLDISYNSLSTFPSFISNLSKLKYLIANNNSFSSLPIEIENLIKLVYLDFNTNQITSLPDQFTNLLNLTDLNLSNNLLENLPEGFVNLTKLTKLYLLGIDGLGNLSYNFDENSSSLSQYGIPGELKKMIIGGNGTTIDISVVDAEPLLSCSLTQADVDELNSLIVSYDLRAYDENYSLTNHVFSYNNDYLKYLGISQANAGMVASPTTYSINDWCYTIKNVVWDGGSTLPSSLWKLSNLEGLDISRNGLSEMPPEIGNLTKLQHIVAYSNGFTTLPSEIGNLTKLKNIDLFNNQITTLPVEFGNLVSLEEFYITYNPLESFPSSIGNLVNLKILVADQASLISLPVEIGNLINLLTLNLSYNQITSLPTTIGNLSSLSDFDFSNNQVSVLPTTIGNLSNLTVLNGYYNNINSIPTTIGSMTSLNKLNLSHNQIPSVPTTIGNLTNLEELILANNQILSIPTIVCSLNSLIGLDFSNNLLSNLPIEIVNLTNLQYFDLSGNDNLGEIAFSFSYNDTYQLTQLGLPTTLKKIKMYGNYTRVVIEITDITLSSINDCPGTSNIKFALSQYPGCSVNDFIVCTGVGTGYTISACNVGATVASSWDVSNGNKYQFGTASNSWNTGSVTYSRDWKSPGGTDAGSANDWGVLDISRNTATWANSDSLSRLSMKGPCSDGYHVPTYLEWLNILAGGGWGSNGTNMSDALKMPMAGSIDRITGTSTGTTIGYYWTSSPYLGDGDYLYFKYNALNVYNHAARSYGFSVRCIKN
ncbi:MAG: pre-peptidase C-terminal domain-containing protein [Candidatus Gracilibacteria bacterium]|nr:pre-peptidase C-terminal domain-containing protein [Candidatus Gracilibacteria bacterium]